MQVSAVTARGPRRQDTVAKREALAQRPRPQSERATMQHAELRNAPRAHARGHMEHAQGVELGDTNMPEKDILNAMNHE